MKLQLGGKQIQLSRVQRVCRVGQYVAQIDFKTGESIHVKCGVHFPDGMTISYHGTFEELKALIDKFK
ncbi:hypothetical protein C6503_00190 [Candidatus Poribacteria bacterium]|nr:MAG: hypothetical protein C6503_00190 [Candidatus Poribacteria bacterium]